MTRRHDPIPLGRIGSLAHVVPRQRIYRLADPLARLRSGSVFYGWWIVVAGLVIELVTLGLFLQAYGTYAVVLRTEFGWSATVIALGFVGSRVAYGAAGPLQGWLVDKHGPRRVVSLGAVTLAFGLVLLSQVDGIATFFLATVVMAVGASMAGFYPLSNAVVHWFDRRRSTALAFLSLGLALSALPLPLIVLGFDLIGWRGTALISSIVLLLFALPAAQILRSPTPGRNHERPAGPSLDQLGGNESVRLLAISLAPGEAFRSRRFWFLSLGHTCAAVVTAGMLVYLVPHLTEGLTFTLAEASGYVVMLAAAMAAGTLTGGIAGDRIDRGTLIAWSMVGHVVSLPLLAYASTGWMIAIAVLTYGFAWGVRDPLIPAVRADYFGLRSYGTISGMSAPVIMLGMVTGPVIAGLSNDLTGSYAPAFMLFGAVAGVGSLLFVLAARGGRAPDVGPDQMLAAS